MIFKACQGKAQGDFQVSHSMKALCYTFSLCFPTTQLSKKSTTFQCAQEAPEGWHTPICTACRAAQRLHCAAALMVLQPELHYWHDTGKCYVHQGWSGKSRSLDVSAPVTGPVQPAKKEYDSDGHAFSSSFSWSYRAHNYPWENPRAIWQESFSQYQGRSQAAQYLSRPNISTGEINCFCRYIILY